ncbi:MAG TPA: helix-hairpin-helix domain-containing protein [Acetobacteraceae bacterium]|nr:helix-hairpin-helix domain-containing protein [Acetobacteraceae bacterium]
MPSQDQPHRHGHPGQREARSHGETHHEMRQVNLNTASREELEDLPMVGPKRAEALIAARPLRSWEDVAKVPGFEFGMIDDLRSGGAALG